MTHSARQRNHQPTLRRRQRTYRPAQLERLEARRVLDGTLTAMWLADDLVSDAIPAETITEWNDSVGGRTATAAGMPALITNQVGGRAVMRFDGSDGSDSFVLASSNNPLSNADDFSVVVVFRTDATDHVTGTGPWFENSGIVDGNQLGFGRDWGLTIDSSGRIATGLGGGFTDPPTTIATTDGGYNNGELQVATVTRSGSQLTLAIDGQPVAETTAAPDSSRGSMTMRFGALSNGTNPFIGDIAQVRLYDGALNDAESAAILADINEYYTNAAPQALDDVYDVSEDAGLFIIGPGQGVLVNDSDADGDPLTAVLAEPDRRGVVRLNANGSFAFATERDFFGTETFTYTANDHRPSEPATVTINVLPVYDAPVPVEDSYLIRPGDIFRLPAIVGLLANDGNPDRAPLTASLARPASAGDLELSANGAFVFDPQDFAGVATFAYNVDDGVQVTGPVEVTIAVNTPPVAMADSYITAEDQPLVVDETLGLIGNDVDSQPDNVLTASVVDMPEFGTLVLAPDGSFRYEPNVEFSGSDRFTYELTDGFETSEVAEVVIEVTTVDDPPVAIADSYLAPVDIPVAFDARSGLLANDSDVEGQPITARLITPAANGTVVVQSDGSFSYQPRIGFTGKRFVYLRGE